MCSIWYKVMVKPQVDHSYNTVQIYRHYTNNSPQYTVTTSNRSPPPFADFRVNTQPYVSHFQGHLPYYCKLIHPTQSFCETPSMCRLPHQYMAVCIQFSRKIIFVLRTFASNIAILRTAPSHGSKQDVAVVCMISKQFAYRYKFEDFHIHSCYKKLEVQLLNRNVKCSIHERSPQVHTSTHPVCTQYHWSAECYKSASVCLVRASPLKVCGVEC